MRFLEVLLSLIFPLRPDERLVQETSIETLFSLCEIKEWSNDGYTSTVLLPYRVPEVSAHIREAKFHKNKKAFTALSYILSDYLAEYIAEETAFRGSLVVVPIPLGKKRLQERGYNQIEEVCTKAQAMLGDTFVVAPSILIRNRETLPQTALKASERKKNTEDAFRVSTSLNLSSIYILIDDVITTGATLQSATKALQKAGAKHVRCIALAH